jgi:hydroxyacylglutathione hydrolase
MLETVSFTLGPAMTNAYLVADPGTKEAAVIDPAWDGQLILAVALHPADHTLWRAQGGAPLFGYQIDPGPEPGVDLVHGQILRLGSVAFEVRHTPGHTPGLCCFYVATEGICFCGDLIFRGGVGRTDLPGGDWQSLLDSIQQQIFSLPDETRLLSGHGPETTVGEEKRNNPYLDL